MGGDPMAVDEDGEYDSEEQDDSGMPTMEEMMREAMADDESWDDETEEEDAPTDDDPGDGKPGDDTTQ